MKNLLFSVILISTTFAQAEMDMTLFAKQCALLHNVKYPIVTCQAKTNQDETKLKEINLSSPFTVDLRKATSGSAGPDNNLRRMGLSVRVKGFWLTSKNFNLDCNEIANGKVEKGIFGPTVDIENLIDFTVRANLDCQ